MNIHVLDRSSCSTRGFARKHWLPLVFFVVVCLDVISHKCCVGCSVASRNLIIMIPCIRHFVVWGIFRPATGDYLQLHVAQFK